MKVLATAVDATRVGPALGAGWIGRHPVAAFLLLCFGISHLLNPVVVEMLRLVAPGLHFDYPPAQLNHRSLLNQAGPSVAALIVLWRLHGWAGLRAPWRGCRLDRRAAVGVLTAIAMPLAVTLLSYRLAGVELTATMAALVMQFPLYMTIVGGFVLSSGLTEELGWRGFLLPQLLKNGGPLRALGWSYVVTVAWHLPALLAGWKTESLLPWLPLALAATVLLSAVFVVCGGNLLVPILFHACFNGTASFFAIVAPVPPQTPLHQGWCFVALYVGLSVLALVAMRAFTKAPACISWLRT
jgi:uncharacterized protein